MSGGTPRVTVYVLKGTTNGRRYVGITNDLPRRLREHACGSTRAGRIIGEFEVLHTEVFPDHPAARVRERFLKSGQGRKWLDELEALTWLARGE
jgi:putative endonuclease